MRTSLNDLKNTEDYLAGTLSGEESALFQSKLILDQMLRTNVAIQKLLYRLVVDFGRRSTKHKLEHLHQRLFADPKKKNFQDAVYREFKKR